MGLRPSLGRLLTDADHSPSTSPALVLSHGAWTRFFGSDTAIVGQQLRTSRAVYTIVGVGPAGFDGTVEDDIVEFFVPVQHYEPRALQTNRNGRSAWAIARLAPGVTMADAQGQVGAVGATLAQRYPAIYGRYTARIEPMGESWREGLRSGSGLLFAASALLLVIAAINVGCLLLARVLDRRRELAIRASLGAGTRRLMGQLFVEAVVLVAIGGAVGVMAGPTLLDAFLRLSPVALPRYVQLSPDAITLSIVLGTLALAGLLAGTVPALIGRRVQPGDVLRDSGRGTLGRVSERRWTTLLIAGETALTLVLLVAGGLLFRSFDRLNSVDVGFDRTRIARLAVTLNPTDVGGAERLPALYERLRAAIAAQPGVDRVGLVAPTLPPWDGERGRVLVQGIELDPASRGLEAGIHFADHGLLPMMGTRVVAGRNIEPSDAAGAAHIALVSNSLAQLIGGTERALGRIVTLVPDPDMAMGAVPPPRVFRIVGVAEDIAYDGLVEQDTRRYVRGGDAGDARAGRYDVYFSLAQSPTTVISIGVSTAGDAAAMIAPVRQTIGSIAPASAVHWVSTMDDEIALEYASSRFYSVIVVLFSASALLLTSIGLFALLSHAAAQRRSEMGLRLALGATPRSTASLLLRTGMLPLAAGVAGGLAGAVFVSRMMRGMLYGVGAFDPMAFVAAVSALLLVSFAAGLIPARRVATVDPITTLRGD